MKRDLIILLLSLFVLNINFVVAQQTRVDSLLTDFKDHPEYILVAAHRAAHQKYPENSQDAILEAIRVKTDIVELDVRETKDHELVVIHDKTVDRVTARKGLVENYTLSELKEMPLLYDEQPTDQRILTFEEALLLTKDKIIIDVDFKADTKEALNKALALIEKNGMEKQVLFYIYDDYEFIKAIKKNDSSITIMPRAYSKKDIDKLLKMSSIEVIHIDFSFYTDDLMQNVLKKGIRIWANALGKYDEKQVEKGTGYDEIIKMNINIIQTDYPEELLEYLKMHGRHR